MTKKVNKKPMTLSFWNKYNEISLLKGRNANGKYKLGKYHLGLVNSLLQPWQNQISPILFFNFLKNNFCLVLQLGHFFIKPAIKKKLWFFVSDVDSLFYSFLFGYWIFCRLIKLQTCNYHRFVDFLFENLVLCEIIHRNIHLVKYQV